MNSTKTGFFSLKPSTDQGKDNALTYIPFGSVIFE